MSTTLRRLDLMLVCEICDGEVDLHDDVVTAQCRHCGIAFAIDLEHDVELEERLGA